MRMIMLNGPVLLALCEEMLQRVKPEERITDIELKSACTSEGLESHLLMAEVEVQEAETVRTLTPIACLPHRLEGIIEANKSKLEVEFIPRINVLMPGTGIARCVGVIYRECLIEEDAEE